MTPIPDDRFVATWNAADSLGAALEMLCGMSGGLLPRWGFIAHAYALKRGGASVKSFPDEQSVARSLGMKHLEAIQSIARKLMADHGLAGWGFRFNRNVRRAGVCRYPTPARPGRIELSSQFVLRNEEAEVRDTILHEIAHALVGQKHGHDAIWKAKCAEIGARPERCFGGEVAMPKGRWRATCPGCRREYDRHRRPPRLTGWYCKPCGKDRGSIQWAPM